MGRPADRGAGGGELGRLGALVRLHLTLGYRFSSGSSRQLRWLAALAAVMVVGWLAVVSGALGLLAFRVTRGLGAASPDMTALYLGFGLLFLFLFLFVGIFEQGMGCGVDLSRLFHLPVPTWSLLAAGLLARLAAPHTVLTVGFLAAHPAAVVADGHPWLALLFLPAALLWLTQLHLLAVVVSLLTSGARRSRVVVERVGVAGLALFVVYVGVMLSPLQARVDAAVRVLIDLIAAHWKALLPALRFLPGVSALAWQGTGRVDFLLLGVAILETACLFILGLIVLDRLAVTGGERAPVRRAPTQRRRPRPGVRLLYHLDRLPLLAKELRVTVRDPAAKVELLVFGLLPLAGGLALGRVGHRLGDAALHHVAPLLVLFLLKDRFCNHLCRDAGGLVQLIGSPLPRWRLLLEKNLATMTLLAVLMAVPGGLLAWRGASPTSILLDCAFTLACGAILCGVGNFLAMLAPIPMQLKRGQLAPQMPMGRLLLTELTQILALAAAGWLALPIVAVHLVYVQIPQPSTATLLAVACTLVHGSVVYAFLLVKAGDLFSTCEPDLFEEVVRAAG